MKKKKMQQSSLISGIASSAGLKSRQSTGKVRSARVCVNNHHVFAGRGLVFFSRLLETEITSLLDSALEDPRGDALSAVNVV